MRSGPVLWFGGKGHVASWIVEHLPEHEVYVEPYGGAGAVLFNKEPVPIEVFNDLHRDLINLFRVLADPDLAAELQRRVTLVLHSRAEYEDAVAQILSEGGTSIERAIAFFVAMNQGFGGTYPSKGRWAKSRGQRLSGGMGNNTAQWWRKVAFIDEWHERLARCQIECRDALEVVADYDSPTTLHYLDPPYLMETRTHSTGAYIHEVGEDHHRDLVKAALDLEGRVVLSGYAHPIYEPLEAAGWRVVDRGVHARGAGNKGGKRRIERLWINDRD